MIDYLIQRLKVKEQSNDIVYLYVLKDIQREIVQSCTGVLTETRFHEILKLIQEVCKNTLSFNILVDPL